MQPITNDPTHHTHAPRTARALLTPPPYAQGPGTLQLDQIAPNYALRMLMEEWIAAHAATGATVPATRDNVTDMVVPFYME